MSFKEGGTTWLVVRRKGGGFIAIPEYDHVAAKVVDGKLIREVHIPPYKPRPWHWRPRGTRDELIFLTWVVVPILAAVVLLFL